MSRILVDQIRSNSASADAMTLDGSGNLTVPGNITLSGNATISGTATGFGGGKLLQAVTASYGSNAFNYTTTLANTGLGVSITPSSTSSKILVMVSQTYIVRKSGADMGFSILVYRDSTAIMDDINSAHYHNHANLTGFGSGGQWFEFQGTWNHTILDSPNTTSAINYKTMFGLYNTSGGHLIGTSNDGKESFITALEIGA